MEAEVSLGLVPGSSDSASPGANPLRTLHQGKGRRGGLREGAVPLAMPFVGRDDVLQQLDTLLGRSVDYQAPQLATLLGAPGLGKSRTLQEWIARVRAARPEVAVVEVAARLGDSTTPFGLMRRLLARRLQVGGGEGDAAAFDQTRRELEAVFGDRRLGEILFLMAPYLGLERKDLPPSALGAALTEGDEGLQTSIGRSLLRRFFELDGARRPLVLVVDDLHLADLESIAVLQELAVRLVGTSVMVVAGARSDLLVRFAGWGEEVADGLRLDLLPLSHEETARLLRELLARVERLPNVVVQKLCDHVAGTPAFVGELVTTFFERQIVYSDGTTWRIDQERALDVNLSLTVEEAVHARLAELSAEERDLLEKAALFEGAFWTGALVALDRMDHKDRFDEPLEDSRRRVEQQLDDLTSLEYLMRIPGSTMPGETELVFRHNLERELVARLVPAERARRCYRRIAQWIETKWNEVGEALAIDQLEMKAHYFELGGDKERAAQGYLAAASEARHVYAYQLAAELYERSLKLLHPEDVLVKVDVLHGYGTVLQLLGRTADARPVFEQMLAAAAATDQIAKVGAAWARIAQLARERGGLDEAERLLAQAREFFRRASDTRGVGLVEDQLGRCALDRGDSRAALEHHQRALDLRRALDDPRPVAVSLHQVAELHHLHGLLGEADARYAEALAVRRKADDQLGMLQTLSGQAALLRDRGDLPRALELALEAETLAGHVASRPDEARIQLRLVELHLRLGQDKEAADRLKRAQSLIEGLDSPVLEAELGRIGAEQALGSGEPALAVRRARAAVEAAGRAHNALAQAFADRTLALALRAAGEAPDEATQRFAEAARKFEGLAAELELKRTRDLEAVDASDMRRSRRATPPPLPPIRR